MGWQLSIELKLLNAADLHNLLLNSGKCYASSLSLIWQSLFNLVLITFSACFFLIQISSRNIKRMLEEKNVWKSEGEGHFSPHEVLLCLLQYVCLFGEDLQGLSSLGHSRGYLLLPVMKSKEKREEVKERGKTFTRGAMRGRTWN